jgi:hypothetical protein
LFGGKEGEWLEPIGVVSLISEVAFAIVTLGVLLPADQSAGSVRRANVVGSGD